ncbi:hypothetical protein BGZ76_008841 [Entomortierella beljakovae]|nr:hypothetical protein BGZ76_008841 [Entomortierella beljakovae]
MSVKNLIFDLGNVVLGIDQDACARNFKELGAVGFPTLENHAAIPAITDFEVGKISVEEFRSGIRSATNLPDTVTDEQFDKAWNSMLLDFPKDRLEFIRSLKNDFGYKVFLLSNTNSMHIEYVDKVCLQDYKEDSLHPFFDKVYYSHDIGHRKPSEEAFDVILKDQNLVASETLFLDDMAVNVEAAKLCGLQAAQVDVDTDLSFLHLRF